MPYPVLPDPINTDNTNEIKTSLYGKNAAAGDTAIQVNSDGSQQMDLRKVLGAAMSATNPVITQAQFVVAALGAKVYTATTGDITLGTSATGGLSIFNNSTAKTIIIFSIEGYNFSTGIHVDVRMTTSDPALGTAVTPVNASAGGAASSLTCSSATTGVGTPGTLRSNTNTGSSA